MPIGQLASLPEPLAEINVCELTVLTGPDLSPYHI